MTDLRIAILLSMSRSTLGSTRRRHIAAGTRLALGLPTMRVVRSRATINACLAAS